MIELVDNQYGKHRVRLMKVTRHTHGNDVYEWTVAILLRGDFASAHTVGDNSKILATDTMKNTVYWVAGQSRAATPEHYAFELIDYILERNLQVRSAHVTIHAHLWKRLTIDGAPHPDTFMRGSNEVQTVRIERARDGDFVVHAGLSGLNLLKTANSSFSGFIRDSLTSLPETEDRVFGTVVEAEWHYVDPSIDYAKVREQTRETLLRTFANHKSRSVQQTLYAIAQDVFEAVPAIDEIHLTMPNKHCLLVDLARFGGDNPNEILVPTDEPHGYIDAHLRRKANG
jgi:urate oxidase